MSKKLEKSFDIKSLVGDDKIKFEIAEEIGVADKVIKSGWKSLSAKESGKIGGIMASRKKKLRKLSEESH